ncbi:hypothetical protein N7G274_002642 [Stereocaulon virgatum]|uniref:Uncharacterized protein n=1 Tax=Stereocaulon virgatum TaxID=373712 RepID=A0ABR4AJM5_9LECA
MQINLPLTHFSSSPTMEARLIHPKKPHTADTSSGVPWEVNNLQRDANDLGLLLSDAQIPAASISILQSPQNDIVGFSPAVRHDHLIDCLTKIMSNWPYNLEKWGWTPW